MGKDTHDERIAEQTDGRDTNRKRNRNCEDEIAGLNRTVATIKKNTQDLINNHERKCKETVQCKDIEINALKSQISDFTKENDGLKGEFQKATDSTAGLKTALEQARDKLSDALVEGAVTVN